MRPHDPWGQEAPTPPSTACLLTTHHPKLPPQQGGLGTCACRRRGSQALCTGDARPLTVALSSTLQGELRVLRLGCVGQPSRARAASELLGPQGPSQPSGDDPGGTAHLDLGPFLLGALTGEPVWLEEQACGAGWSGQDRHVRGTLAWRAHPVTELSGTSWARPRGWAVWRHGLHEPPPCVLPAAFRAPAYAEPCPVLAAGPALSSPRGPSTAGA